MSDVEYVLSLNFPVQKPRGEKDGCKTIRIPTYRQIILSVSNVIGHPKKVELLNAEIIDLLDFLPAIKIDLKGAAKEHHLFMVWIRKINSWIGIAHRYNCETAGSFDEDYWGPYRLNEVCAEKIRGVFGIPEGVISKEETLHTPPSELIKIADNEGEGE